MATLQAHIRLALQELSSMTGAAQIKTSLRGRDVSGRRSGTRYPRMLDEASTAIGGYREGLTIAKLDGMWAANGPLCRLSGLATCTSSSTPCLARGWRRFPLRRPRRVRERRADGHVVRRFLDCGQDWRVKAAILQCASIASSAGGELSQDHANKETPALVMTGRGELVIKQEGNDVCERYYETHTGPKCFMEIMKGGHMSFTSC